MIESASIRDSLKLSRDIDRCVFCDEHMFELHHIVPRHLGGPDSGPQIPLCATHHRHLHYFTMKLMRGETPSSTPFPESAANVKFNSLFLRLCRIIIDASILQEGSIDPSQPRGVGVKVPHEILVKMHLRKSDLGFTNVGDYVKSLIYRDLSTL